MSKFQLSSGPVETPFFITVFGVEGIGKTTLGAEAPGSYVIDVEGGSGHVEVHQRVEKASIETFQDVLDAMLFAAEQDDCKTIVADSLSKIEEKLWNRTCERKSVKGHNYKSIEDFGYKQGYIFALDEWMDFIHTCEKIIAMGKNVILVGHEMTKKFDDPTMLEGYSRYEIDIHPKASKLIRRYVDAVLFANYKTLVKDGKGLETGERCLFTERRPGHDGKNRYSLPYEMPLSWNELEIAIKAGSKVEKPESYRRQIEGLLPEVFPDETRDKIKAALENKSLSATELKAYLSRVETLIGAIEE